MLQMMIMKQLLLLLLLMVCSTKKGRSRLHDLIEAVVVEGVEVDPYSAGDSDFAEGHADGLFEGWVDVVDVVHVLHVLHVHAVW